MTWKEALQSQRARWALAFCFVTIMLMFLLVPAFYLQILTPKKGYLLDDFLLAIFIPRDWSLPVFAILYAAIGHTLVTSYRKADVVITGLTLYCAVNILRTLCMYLLTLEPPAGMILLRDPISSMLYPDTGFAKDLFFSGHVSTVMVVILIERNRIARLLKVAGMVLMGVLLAWQHVHYTLDLVVAPIATYAVFVFIRSWLAFPPEDNKTN